MTLSLPLVEAVRRKEAPLRPEGLSERCSGSNSLRPSIDSLETDARILRPGRYESPSRSRESADWLVSILTDG
jgi:hypothetical protein